MNGAGQAQGLVFWPGQQEYRSPTPTAFQQICDRIEVIKKTLKEVPAMEAELIRLEKALAALEGK